MDKNLEKLLFNPIRLKIISFLISVEKANFKKLIEITESSKGNVSTQIKKLENQGLLKINKTYFNNYPLTLCQITNKGKKAFKVFFDNLKSIKNNGLICLGLIVLNKYIISYCESFSFIQSPGSDCIIFKKYFSLFLGLVSDFIPFVYFLISSIHS